MSTLLCCCDETPVNVCGCTWPRVLSYKGNVDQAGATFYFPNLPDGGTPEPVYTLTWQSRPSDIPRELELLYYTTGGIAAPVYVTMPDEAWFSGAIACHVFGQPTSVYFYMWMRSCQANVLVIDAPYGSATVPDGTKGAGNNVISYLQTQCDPQFQMKNNLFQPPKIYGDHGVDDIVPNAAGGAGGYINGRTGTTYTLTMTILNPTTGVASYTTTVGNNRRAALTITLGGGGYTPPPGGSVAWSSSNGAVATVSGTGSGSTATIVPVATGSAVITATISGDPVCTTTTVSQTVTVT